MEGVVYHIPVLLKETVDGLDIKPDGIYVDVTMGGGGHSREILRRLGPNGRLIAFDQDADAKRNIPDDPRLTFVAHNFRFLNHFLDYLEIPYIDGLLADLGVSSHHFDDAQRGFSFRFDAPLDMRMSSGMPLSAADIIKGYSTEELTRVLDVYGEVKEAKRIAQRMKGASEMATTGDLRNLIESSVNPKVQSKVLAQVFQALRIEVNHEMEALEEMLLAAVERLKPGSGRLSVLSYHSLEDRMLKNLIRTGNPLNSEPIQDAITGRTICPLEAVNRKPIEPSAEEIEENPRSRSAKLRVAQKL